MDKKKINWLSLAIAFVFAIAGTGFSQTMTTNHTETATFGGGCFWCMEAEFQRIPGVIHVTSGFAGGHMENPSYHDVCTGTTGHAEVTQIEYDPQKLSYDKLLN